MLVAEGYATAASLHEATGYPVAVAFDAGKPPAGAIIVIQRVRRWVQDGRVPMADLLAMGDYLDEADQLREDTGVTPDAVLAEALAQHPTAKCSWIRSHLTVEHAVAEVFPARWNHGNSLADEAAKEAALAVNVSPQLLHQHRQHVEEAAKVVTVVAGIQLARLQARTRTSDGAALKVRRRQQPGLPRRLRPKGIKRKAAAAVMEAALGEAEAQPSPPACSVLLHAKEHELPGPAMARRAIEESPVPAAGIHDLRPVEPWPAMGSGVFKNYKYFGLTQSLFGRNNKNVKKRFVEVPPARSISYCAILGGVFLNPR
jgi:hypothetical protein